MLVGAKSTKDLILRFIKTSGRLSIIELASELGISEMAVRRHIQVLEKEAYIESVILRQTKGRPSKLYQLTKKGEDLFPKKYKQLSVELLRELKSMGQESLITELFTRRKNRLVQQYEIQTSEKTFAEKLEVLTEIQLMEGFMPEIRKEEGHIHLKEYNCPYIETAAEFKQICKSEKEFIKDFLDTEEVEIKSCMATGDGCCHYIINQD
ncbi:winged helix-turn-helix transcriptional regulator [Bacillus sp. ISL-47]|uniref:helix-turn-helix transcriptional regulator n=1 Tax=Bacillus sp. ISL-47 TaxID=2819130 RepID=UPI001BE7550E|nr:winged helix-turn-helix transcriptional regulator [Bacillus sp. ISL-47]MBT2687560.1 winged helix-turn-helix transcriptional regulator [Bacillus sp. ISL-47]MBT2706443.1 winged helix-turn-helix transcriptional regulator [Pseudomonas sp. ISL-84]